MQRGVSWSGNWLLRLTLSSWDKRVHTCTYTRTHAHTHQVSIQGWAAIPLRSPLDDIHIRRYWTESHGGKNALLRSCDQSEEMNESHFLRLCVCCAACLPALDYSIHHHVPTDLSPKEKHPPPPYVWSLHLLILFRHWQFAPVSSHYKTRWDGWVINS